MVEVGEEEEDEEAPASLWCMILAWAVCLIN